jgi:hypothetical protein
MVSTRYRDGLKEMASSRAAVLTDPVKPASQPIRHFFPHNLTHDSDSPIVSCAAFPFTRPSLFGRVVELWPHELGEQI